MRTSGLDMMADSGFRFLVDAAARAAERRKSGGSLLSEGTGSISSPW